MNPFILPTENISYVDINERELKYMKQAMCIISLSILTIILCYVVIPYIINADSSSNVMWEYIQQDTFRHDRPNSSSIFFQKIASTVFRVLLPFMSIFALSMMMLSLISSIIFLSKPDFFEEVHTMKEERRQAMSDTGSGNIFQRTREYVSSVGPKSFFMSYIPDFKAYAFYEATKADADGVMSIGTFLKWNLPKFIALSGFCILINDATMMTLVLTGGELGATVIRKITYQYDYNEMLENWMESGKDYKPMFATNTVEGSNKKKTFDAMLRIVKEYGNKDAATMTSEAKNAYGVTIVNIIEGNAAGQMGNSVDWSARKLSVKAQYTITPVNLASDVAKMYTYPLSQFGLSEAGYLQVQVQTTQETQNAIGFYPNKANWTRDNSNVKLNVNGFATMGKDIKFDTGSKVTCTIYYNEVSNADIQAGANFVGSKTVDVKVTDTELSVTLDKPSDVAYIKFNNVRVKSSTGKITKVPREPVFVLR